MKTCSACKGSGQTKTTKTEFHFEPKTRVNKDTGHTETIPGKQYVTDKLGSGCLNCGGRGAL